MKKAILPIEIFQILQATDLDLWFFDPNWIESHIQEKITLISNSNNWEELSYNFSSFLTISNLMKSREKFQFFDSLDPFPEVPPYENVSFQNFISMFLYFFQQNFGEFYKNIYPIFQILKWGFQIIQLKKNQIPMEENIFIRVFSIFLQLDIFSIITSQNRPLHLYNSLLESIQLEQNELSKISFLPKNYIKVTHHQPFFSNFLQALEGFRQIFHPIYLETVISLINPDGGFFYPSNEIIQFIFSCLEFSKNPFIPFEDLLSIMIASAHISEEETIKIQLTINQSNNLPTNPIQINDCQTNDFNINNTQTVLINYYLQNLMRFIRCDSEFSFNDFHLYPIQIFQNILNNGHREHLISAFSELINTTSTNSSIIRFLSFIFLKHFDFFDIDTWNFINSYVSDALLSDDIFTKIHCVMFLTEFLQYFKTEDTKTTEIIFNLKHSSNTLLLNAIADYLCCLLNLKTEIPKYIFSYFFDKRECLNYKANLIFSYHRTIHHTSQITIIICLMIFSKAFLEPFPIMLLIFQLPFETPASHFLLIMKDRKSVV
jgi:hypothetical protein